MEGSQTWNTEDQRPGSNGWNVLHSFCDLKATRLHVLTWGFSERLWMSCSTAPLNILFRHKNQSQSAHPLFNLNLSLKCSSFLPELSHAKNSATNRIHEQRKKKRGPGFGDGKTHVKSQLYHVLTHTLGRSNLCPPSFFVIYLSVRYIRRCREVIYENFCLGAALCRARSWVNTDSINTSSPYYRVPN